MSIWNNFYTNESFGTFVKDKKETGVWILYSYLNWNSQFTVKHKVLSKNYNFLINKAKKLVFYIHSFLNHKKYWNSEFNGSKFKVEL